MLILCGLIGHQLNTQLSMDPVVHLTSSEPRDDDIVWGNRGIAKTASLRQLRCEERSDAAIHKSNTGLTPRLDRHANARDDGVFFGYARSFIKSRHPAASVAKTGGSIQLQVHADSLRVD